VRSTPGSLKKKIWLPHLTNAQKNVTLVSFSPSRKFFQPHVLGLVLTKEGFLKAFKTVVHFDTIKKG
jgi:hypothetical protein